jgi:hypothetical protein
MGYGQGFTAFCKLYGYKTCDEYAITTYRIFVTKRKDDICAFYGLKPSQLTEDAIASYCELMIEVLQDYMRTYSQRKGETAIKMLNALPATAISVYSMQHGNPFIPKDQKE